MSLNRKKVLVLVAALLVLPLFAAQATADDGQGALSLIPKDTMAVVSINMTSLQKTGIYKELLGMALSDAEVKGNLEKLKKTTGFDFEKDVASIVIAVPPDVEKSENFLMIAKGKVDQKKLIAFAKAEQSDVKESKHQDVTYYLFDGEAAFAVLGDYILLGTDAAVKGAIDVHKSKREGVSKNASLTAMVKSVDKKGNLWMVINLPDSIRKDLRASDPMAGDISAAYASLDFGSGMALALVLVTGKAESASGMAAMAEMALGEVAGDPSLKAMGLDGVMKNLKISAAGKELKVDLKLSPKEFETVKALVQGMAGSMF